MKKIKCYDCEEVFEAETKEEILEAMYSHYMKAHIDVISKADQEEKKAWMEKFEKDWAAIPN